MFFKTSLVLLCLLFLACSTKKTKTYKRTIAPPYKTIVTSKEVEELRVSKSLYKEYAKYKGVVYKYGGTNHKGIDCSALVQNVYKNAFNIKVPRTTRDQAKIGFRVDKKSAKVGDMILFKTGYNARHSGIIIEKGKFLHASTKYGVIITDIDKTYYKKRYWQIRRVLN